MYKNNNKTAIKKLAQRSLKSGKLRNILVVATIALAVSLMLVLVLYLTGVKEKEKISFRSAAQVTYHGVSKAQMDSLENDSRIEEILFTKSDKAFEIENDMIKLFYAPNESDKIKTIWEKLTEGSFPKEENEIVVEKAYLEEIGLEPKIGTSVSITFLDGITENFVVSGILDTNPIGKSYTIYTSKAYAENGSQLKNNAYDGIARIDGGDKMSEQEFIGSIHGIGEENDISIKNIKKNNGFVSSISVDPAEITAMVLIGALVILASTLVIYSIFYISVLGKTRQFGQLRTIGMTQKQIKKMIRQEGLILSGIGISLGIVISWSIAYLIIPEGWQWTNTLLGTLAVGFVNLITIMLSIRKPGKLASRISPIEATKLSENTEEIKKKEKKKKRITPFNLARASFIRNRKKTLATAISLGISGVLFLVGTTFLTSQNKEEFSRQGDLRFGEYVIQFSTNLLQTSEHGQSDLQMNSPFTNELIEKIKNIPNVEKVETVYGTQSKFEYRDEAGNNTLSPFSRKDVEVLNKYLEEGSIDYDKMVANKEILIMGNDVAMEVYGWKYSLGDTGILHYFNGQEEKQTFTIAGFVETKYGLEKSTGWYLIPEETMNELMGEMNLISDLIISGDYKAHGEQIEADLQKLTESNPMLSLMTLREALERDESTIKSLYMMVLGLSLFICIFSLINMINTLITGLLTRKQEFALLESVGMSASQFFKMIQYEGIILAVINLGITLIIGTPIGYAIVALLRDSGVTYFHYQFPIWYMFGYAAVIILIPIFIGWVFIKNNKKQTLVERLREGE